MAKLFGAKVFLVSVICLIIISCCNCFATNKIAETEQYDVHSTLTRIDDHTTIVKLRQKRQTPTDIKNQYQSVPQNATDPKQTLPPNTVPQQTDGSSAGLGAATSHDTSVVVPYSGGERPLVGVNGTGQRKEYATSSSDKPSLPTIVSDPIQPTTLAGAPVASNADEVPAKKPNQLKKVPGVGVTLAAAAAVADTSDEKLAMNVDVPENETLNALQNQNLTINQTTDHHSYYNSTMYVNKEEVDQIWNTIKNYTLNPMLSQSHRRAMTIELSFDFPFYGHMIRNVTVATGGFLYTGDYVHSWLAATQYIAPLMANFDTTLSNESYVRVNDNGTALTVLWENVALQDKNDKGNFTFSATLHKNGDIVFTYFSVPILVHTIEDDKHPVKVGLSDAYIIDKMVYFARRKTIYEYHRVNFASSEITNSTIIFLKALHTCLGYFDCVSCINHDTTFACAWCPGLNRCSTGTDRKKQDWLQNGCDRSQITNTSVCPALGQTGNNYNQTNSNAATAPSSSNSNNSNNNNNNSNGSDKRNDAQNPHEPDNAAITPLNVNNVGTETKAALNGHAEEPKTMGLALGVMVPICMVTLVLVWILYAYRNPHTKSGQLLIQYRPSQWSWRRGEARYTAATIHM